MRVIVNLLLTVAVMFSLGEFMASAQYDKDVFSFRGRRALADGKYSLAIENFNVLARLDTTDYWTFFFRGIAKYNLGDLHGAQQDFNTSVRLNPVFTSGYHYRAITRSRFGKYDDALADLQKAIDLRPGFVGLYFSRGVTYFLSQQFDKAVSDFNRYIRKEPKDPSAYLNRGASYLFLGDTLKAMSDYNMAIRLDRFDPEGYIRRGRLYASENEFDRAIADMDKAIELDTANTYAYFNRAIMLYEKQDYIGAMEDLNRVLRDEPGNALTLYNRGLIRAQVGEYEGALSDLDRVLNINPDNVLAYFNRASVFIEMGRWQDALEDYDKAIDLYPDFAKAYMNRAYVKNMMGDYKASQEDYRTAREKVREYREATEENAASFADTTRKYSSLLALDAEFARDNFNDELLQHRDIDIRLRPLYKFVLAPGRDGTEYALERRYENPLIDRFVAESPVPVVIANTDTLWRPSAAGAIESVIYGDGVSGPVRSFLRAMFEYENRQYNSSLGYYDEAVSGSEALADKQPDGPVQDAERYYAAFYYMNRGVLRAEMIDFISSIENNVQVLTMDDSGTTRARVRDQVSRQYDYTEAIADMSKAAGIVPDIPYIFFNLGNLYCLAAEHVRSIDSYTRAIELFPYMGDAYFNRGLVQIYLKDKEKGCIDLSRAGELGVSDAYSVIKKYCEQEQ